MFSRLLTRLATFFSGLTAQPADPQRRVVRLRQLVAALALVLLGVTWQLWTPQTAFPQVPVFCPLAATPAWAQWLLLAGQLASLVVVLVRPSGERLARPALLTFAALTLASALVDQHRLQPWAYQFSVLAVVLALGPPQQAGTLARLLTVSLYFYSALSKLDYVFLHTVGQQFLRALLAAVHVDAATLSDPMRLALAALFPVGELLVAVGLCFRRSASIALVASIVMHVLLLIAVGPFGLGHKPGVLVWNLFFLAQNLLLFARLRPLESMHVERRARLPQLLLIAVVTLPALEPVGGFDHWLAWGLYAPKSSRVLVYLHRSAANRLEAPLQAHLGAAAPDSPWLRLRLDDWSLAALDVPLYPQARFQLGVAEAVAERYGLNRLIRAELFSAADRLTGKRESLPLAGHQQIAAASENFWLCTRPGALYLHAERPSQ